MTPYRPGGNRATPRRGVGGSPTHAPRAKTPSNPPPPPPLPAMSATAVDDGLEPDEEGIEEVAPAPLAAGPVRDPQEIEAFGPNGELLRMVKGEDGVFRTVSTNVPPPPVGYNTDHPLLQQLRSRTHKVDAAPTRAPAYNNTPLWYMKPDGEVVKLQGDPGNRAYYEDKGYVVLRREEVDTYLKDQTRLVPDGRGGYKKEIVQPAVRKIVMRQQARRAQLISMIRNIAARNTSVELAGDLSFTPTDELEQLLQQLQSHQSVNFTLLQARQRPMQERDEDAEEMEGVELASGEDLYRRMAASKRQGRLVETDRMAD